MALQVPPWQENPSHLRRIWGPAPLNLRNYDAKAETFTKEAFKDWSCWRNIILYRIHCRFSLRSWNIIIMVLLMAEILPTTQWNSLFVIVYHSLSQYFFRVYTYIITSLNNSDISVMVSDNFIRCRVRVPRGGPPPVQQIARYERVELIATNRDDSDCLISSTFQRRSFQMTAGSCQRGSCVT